MCQEKKHALFLRSLRRPITTSIEAVPLRHETVYAHLFILVLPTGSFGCQNEIRIGGTQH
ncbi:hypothetical protein PISMIDRAFT_684893 [Pisolithus microcarpus 441]|uniref:Unplaced genomic scaffold scaffold_134, whole genome shotgun sequence n=1 Tax=Pisolithus microcarpus 441 TaxID=765257 RepID=A0A0C9Z5W3_9AGAM|nr:hypothetical protein PISMIDRAFT_684893 [Pisolithus microcarpus 441]